MGNFIALACWATALKLKGAGSQNRAVPSRRRVAPSSAAVKYARAASAAASVSNAVVNTPSASMPIIAPDFISPILARTPSASVTLETLGAPEISKVPFLVILTLPTLPPARTMLPPRVFCVSVVIAPSTVPPKTDASRILALMATPSVLMVPSYTLIWLPASPRFAMMGILPFSVAT